MDSPFQPPAGTLQYVLYTAAISLLTGGIALGRKAWRKRFPTALDKVQIQKEQQSIVDRAWDRIDEQMIVINTQYAELCELRPLKAEIAELRSWSRRMQKFIHEKGLTVPERWESYKR